MIANCGHDEHKRFSGGIAGDQKGDEWQVINWYKRPWNYILRHPDPNVGKTIAELAYEAAHNDLIGYDQSDRYTFWVCLKEAGYRPCDINTPCEADCSSGVAAIVKATGYLLGLQALQEVSIYAYTGNLREVLKRAGFKVLSGSEYTDSSDNLLKGDILLYEGHHTAINLDDGLASIAETVTIDDQAPVMGMPGLVNGSKGPEVKTLQRLLNAIGYNCGSVDGVFGKKTEIAVKNFQNDKRISVTTPGTVGSKTWTILLKGC